MTLPSCLTSGGVPAGIVKPERPSEEPRSPVQGVGRKLSNDNDLDLLARQGIFTAAFTVQVRWLDHCSICKAAFPSLVLIFRLPIFCAIP